MEDASDIAHGQDYLRLIEDSILVTVKGGSIPVDEQDRRRIAIFDNGVVLLSNEEDRWSPDLRPILKSAQAAGIHLETYHIVEVPKILDIYRDRAQDGSHHSNEHLQIERQAQLAEMIQRAAADSASDIHIRVLPEYTEIRVRVYGRVKDFSSTSMEDGKALIKAALAVASDLGNSSSDTSFQQGALTAKSKLLPRGVDRLRLQYSPTSDGRGGMVMRINYTAKAGETEIDSLGYAPEHIRDITAMRTRTNGMYILAGKVSSGKTTTLQRVLNKMFIEKRREISTYTIEEPVELDLPNAIQVAAKKNPDGTDGFYEAMKASLRSDPNVIVLGETRSAELASLAIQAVMTGHALWSTIHAGSALGILDRLSDLQVESWKLQEPSTVRGLVYQRLTGVMCKHCRKDIITGLRDGLIERDLARRLCVLLNRRPENLYVRGPGCPHCKLGLAGRTVVAETVQTDPQLLELFSQGRRKEMREYWTRPKEKGGMGGLPVLHHALSKVGAGLVDIAEVEEEVDFLSTYERDFMDLRPRLLADVKKLRGEV